MNAVIQELREKLKSDNKLQNSESVPSIKNENIGVEPKSEIIAENPHPSNLLVEEIETKEIPSPVNEDVPINIKEANLGTPEEKVNTGSVDVVQQEQEPLAPLPQEQEPLAPLPQEQEPLETPRTFKRLDEKVPSDRATVGDETDYSEVITEEKNPDTPYPSTELLESLNEEKATLGEEEKNTPFTDSNNNYTQNPVPTIPAIDSEPEPEPETTLKAVNQVTPSEPIMEEPVNVITPEQVTPAPLEEESVAQVTPAPLESAPVTPAPLEEESVASTPLEPNPFAQFIESPNEVPMSPLAQTQIESGEEESRMPVSVSNSFQTIIDYVSSNIASKLSSVLGYSNLGQDNAGDLQNGYIANNINNRTIGSSQGGKKSRRHRRKPKKFTYKR
jgi:hypothetical protein